MNKGPFTPSAFSLGVERLIFGIEFRTIFIHSCRPDVALNKHDTLV